ncbi:MAG: hypothetical protein SOW59_05195 [Corynebacterium sp.]|nr:hypothetical protein [Corynebacterium sp.]
MIGGMHALAHILKTQLCARGFTEHRTGEKQIFLRSVDGMSNAYIAVEASFGCHAYPPEYAADAHIRLPSPHNPAVEWLTPMFRFLVDVSAVAHLLPADACREFIAIGAQRFGQLMYRRPFDLSDTVPTTLGLLVDAHRETRADELVRTAVIAPLGDFSADIEQRAWTLKDLVGMALERSDGIHLQRLHCLTLLVLLAAAGREFRPVLEQVALEIDEYLVSSSEKLGGELPQLGLGTPELGRPSLGRQALYGQASAQDFVAAMNSVYMGWQKVWYFVWIEEDLKSLRIQPAPETGSTIPSRCRWRRYGIPAAASSGLRTKPIDLSLPGRLFDHWYAANQGRLRQFLHLDVDYPIDMNRPVMVEVRRLERQFLDTFVDAGSASARVSTPLVERFISMFGFIICQCVPRSRWVQHPDDAWLHPGIDINSGNVIDLFVLCHEIATERSGRVLTELIRNARVSTREGFAGEDSAQF